MVFYGWWMILAMNIIGMVHGGVWGFGLSAFIIPLTEEFGWTRMEISLGIALSRLEGGIDGPILGWMSDHIGPRWACIISLALSGILLISLSFINSLLLFYVVMLIIFVLPTSPFTAMATAAARWFNRKVGKAMGLLTAGYGLSGILPPVLIWLITNYSWRIAFVVAGTTVLIICIPLSFFIIKTHGPEHYGLLPDGEAQEEKSDPQRSPKTPYSAQKETLKGEEKSFTLREVLKDKSFWLISIATSLSGFASQAIIIHLIPHLINIGFEPELAALGMTVLTLSSSGRGVFGWLGDIFTKRYVSALTFTILLVGCFIFTQVSIPWAIFLALAIFGPGMGQHPIRFAILREYYGREHWGITHGFCSAISAVPTYIGPVYAGWMFDIYGSYVQAFKPLALLWIIAIVLILMARPPQRR